jgi:hypothetical protein
MKPEWGQFFMTQRGQFRVAFDTGPRPKTTSKPKAATQQTFRADNALMVIFPRSAAYAGL